jgi:hypothetical protein
MLLVFGGAMLPNDPKSLPGVAGQSWARLAPGSADAAVLRTNNLSSSNPLAMFLSLGSLALPKLFHPRPDPPLPPQNRSALAQTWPSQPILYNPPYPFHIWHPVDDPATSRSDLL